MEIIIRLKNKEGIVIEVVKSCCYSPDEQGNISCYLGGFDYFTGKETQEKITHIIDNNTSRSLSNRVKLIKIK